MVLLSISTTISITITTRIITMGLIECTRPHVLATGCATYQLPRQLPTPCRWQQGACPTHDARPTPSAASGRKWPTSLGTATSEVTHLRVTSGAPGPDLRRTRATMLLLLWLQLLLSMLLVVVLVVLQLLLVASLLLAVLLLLMLLAVSLCALLLLLVLCLVVLLVLLLLLWSLLLFLLFVVLLLLLCARFVFLLVYASYEE